MVANGTKLPGKIRSGPRRVGWYYTIQIHNVKCKMYFFYIFFAVPNDRPEGRSGVHLRLKYVASQIS